jgi:hypothetical protein
MARITIMPGGRATRYQVGTQARYSFSIGFPTPVMGAPGGANINKPTAGTLTIAGVTVTLGAGDITSPATVAAKIKATAIAGYVVEYDPTTVPFSLTLVATAIAGTTKPTLALGTAKNILFYDESFEAGKAITIGAQDDIRLMGTKPLVFHILFTGGTIPTLQFANGSDIQQAQGTLTYGSAVTLATVNGLTQSYSLTTPANYCRITTQASNTTASLTIAR